MLCTITQIAENCIQPTKYVNDNLIGLPKCRLVSYNRAESCQRNATQPRSFKEGEKKKKRNTCLEKKSGIRELIEKIGWLHRINLENGCTHSAAKSSEKKNGA